MTEKSDAFETFEIRDDILEGENWAYTLAGHLVGTSWKFPEDGVDTIDCVREATERVAGERIKHPEVVLRYEERRISVGGFLQLIDPNDIGNVEPADEISRGIVDFHVKHGWRDLRSDVSGGD